MATAKSVIDVVLGEAGGSTPAERYEDMKAIVSVMVNRAQQLGKTLDQVVKAPRQFSAYGQPLPKGVEKFRAMAEQALQEVQQNGPVHDATFYATPAAEDNLPGELAFATETAGHRYFTDPQNRSILTTEGYVAPDASATLAGYAPVERVAAEPSAFDALFGGYSATPQQSLAGEQGLISARTANGLPSDALGVTREGFSSPLGLLGDRITSGFGTRVGPKTPLGVGSSNHRGLDLSLQANEAGYPVEAAAEGVVTFAGPHKGYGNMVQVQHPDGTSTRYGHLQEVGNIAIGDQIARGTPVGLLGNTCRSRGPHLHFETLDQNGVQVDPRTVVGFNSEVRVPTPEERPTPWDSAVPMAVDRQSLPSLGVTADQQRAGYGLLADTMRQTPSLNLSGAGADLGAAGRLVDNAGVSQGKSGLRDAMLGQQDVGRATDAEMAALQDEANRSRQALEARMGGSLSLTPDQQSVFAERRNNAMGLLAQRTNPFQSAGVKQGRMLAAEPDTLGGAAQTAALVDPVDYPTNVALTERVTGLSPTMTQTVSAAGMNPTADLSAPLGSSEFMGFQSNPGITNANKFGMEPTGVKTVDTGLLSQPRGTRVGVVEGPVTSGVQTPEVEIEKEQAAAQTKQPSRLGRFARNAGASLLGSVAGGALGGPVGALVGSALAREALGAPGQQQGLLGGVKGLLGDRAGQGAWAGVGNLNNIGSGAQAAYGAWGGPKGTTGIATDGSRITSLGNGLVSRIDKFGRETLFRDGQTVGGGGGWGNGGLLGGLFGGNTGDGSRSQADRARDSVGLY